MHILILLGTIIAGLGVWYWRFKAARDVSHEVFDAVGRARGAYRMHNFRKKAESSVLASVDDPALGAAIYLFALANEGQDADHLAEAEIRTQLAAIVPADKMDEFIAYAAWAAKSVVDARDCVRRFKTLWRDNLDTGERAELVEMAQTVAALSPSRQIGQTLAIEALEQALATESR